MVGAWSQWDEIVVVEAEKMKDERRDDSDSLHKAYGHFHPFFLLPVVPSLQRRLRKFRNAEVCYVAVNVLEDCSDRHIHHSSWIELTLAFIWSSTY